MHYLMAGVSKREAKRLKKVYQKKGYKGIKIKRIPTSVGTPKKEYMYDILYEEYVGDVKKRIKKQSKIKPKKFPLM